MRWRGPLRRHEALYRLLLRAYPESLRRTHEDEMLCWFRDHFANTVPGGGIQGRVRFWRLILGDFASTVLAYHVQSLGANRSSRAHERRSGLMEAFTQDVRIALRSFLLRPSFSIIAVVTLGLGIGAVTSVYSVAYGVLLAPLPYGAPDRIVRVGKLSQEGDRLYSLSASDLADLQERNRSFDALAATRNTSLTILGDAEPELIRGAIVSSEFFRVLGIDPALGRAWDRGSDQLDTEPIAILGHGIWQRRWAGDPSVLGSSVELNGTATTVVGVMPAGFTGPEALGQRDTEVWLPLSFLDPQARTNRRNGFLQVLGRVRTDVSLEAARAELATLGESLSREFPGPGDRVFGAFRLRAVTIGQAGGTILPFLGAVALLLAIACVNVANLLLTRASERQSEFALRRAMGARRGRIVRQLLTEGLILGLAGGALGVTLAIASVRAIVASNPVALPRLSEISVDGNVMAFAVVVTLLTTVVFSLAPAMRGSRAELGDDIKKGSKGAGSTVGVARLSGVLVVTEISLSFVLVVAAGLLINSFGRLSQVELGFEPDAVHVVTVSYPGGDAREVTGFYDEVLAGIAALPGVAAVGATVNLPLSGNYRQRRIELQEGLIAGDEGYSVNYQQVTADYFETMGIRVLAGRGLEDRDRPGAPLVAVMNQTLARAMFGARNPVGHGFSFLDSAPDDPPYDIVGVVADSRQQRMDTPGEPELYLSFRQSPSGRMDVVARTVDPNADILSAMRQQVWAVRADLPIRRAVRLPDFVARSIATPRFYMLLLSSFAGLALALALVGIYGTLSYSVSRRTRELGIRMALGASGRSVLGLVLAHGLTLATIGVALGAGLALLTTRVLSSFVFGITPTDPATMFAGCFTVLAAAVIACAVPARRAARLDPNASLRCE